MPFPPFQPSQTLQVLQGRRADFVRQAYYPPDPSTGIAAPMVGVFVNGDITASSLWAGGTEVALATPLVTWYQGNATPGIYQVTLLPADTANITPGKYYLEVTFTRSGVPGTLGWYNFTVLDASGASTGNPGDLITLEFAQLALATISLNNAQETYLPWAITNASNSVCQWLGNQNVLQQNYDQILTTTIDNFVFPLQQPLNWVTRIATARGYVVTVQNQSQAQWATVGYTFGGDWTSGLTVSGITLTSALNGVTTVLNVTFASLSPPTIQTLANAINALGFGWNAVVNDTYGGWAVSELITSDVAAQDGITGAYLEVWTQDLSEVRIMRPGNIIDLRLANAIQGTSTQFAWSMGGAMAFGDNRIVRPSCRVIYNSGYQTVPAAIQQATVEVVKVLLERLKTDMTLNEEKADGYAYRADPRLIESIPLAIRQQLMTYRVRWMGRP